VRVVTWNVNSIRSRTARVSSWIEQHAPDVVLLQETKTADDSLVVGPLSDLGYEVAHHGIDHWNGVAIASRIGLDDVRCGFSGTQRAPFDEARVMSAVCGGVRCWSVYAPNGRELDDPHYLYKLVWLERLRGDIGSAGMHFVAGDFNVAPTDQDIYDPKRWRRRTHASAEERAALAALVDLGLRDVTREHLRGDGVFTWWGYRPGQFELNRGLRIDLALLSGPLADRVTGVWIDRDERAMADFMGEKPSDHAPVVVDLA
jgi:exodeoxyribonuclease III